MSASWFTSDTHFGHANIIRHCTRPFESVEAMDDAIIDRINRHVRPNDTLYHLGDFAFRGAAPAAYRARIKCKNIVLIVGNHDPVKPDGRVREDFASLFTAIHHVLRIALSHRGVARQIVMCHYAMRVWDLSHHGAWHLYGHSHGSLADDPHALSTDVGVDANDFTPLCMDDIAAKMEQKQYKPVDHHKPGIDD